MEQHDTLINSDIPLHLNLSASTYDWGGWGHMPAWDQLSAEETPHEEFIAWLTHLIGFGLALTGFLLSWHILDGVLVSFLLPGGNHFPNFRTKHDIYDVLSCVIYAASLAMMYGSSSLYHGFRTFFPEEKWWIRIFQYMDHCCIYFLIAGTYTPFFLSILRKSHPYMAWISLCGTWLLAFTGVGLKVISLDIPDIVTGSIYITLGWLGAVTSLPVIRKVPFIGLVWLFLGGLCYSTGVFWFVWDTLPFHHSLWHIHAMGGSFMHFIAVFVSIILPPAVLLSSEAVEDKKKPQNTKVAPSPVTQQKQQNTKSVHLGPEERRHRRTSAEYQLLPNELSTSVEQYHEASHQKSQ